MLSYEVTTGGTRHYLMVLPAEIVVGSTSGSGHSDNAGTCTHAAFLAGRYNGDVERTFGRDVLRTVRSACVDATGDPYFGAAGPERELLVAWASLDRVPALAALAEAPDEEGRDLCDNVEPGTTRLSAAEGDLTVTGSRGVLRSTGAAIKLDGKLSGAVAWNGRFYLTDRWHAHVVDASGVRIASTTATPSRFGVTHGVRISGPVRRGDTVGFSFWTMGSQASPTRRALGEVGVLVLGDASEIAGWSPYRRAAAIEHRRKAR